VTSSPRASFDSFNIDFRALKMRCSEFSVWNYTQRFLGYLQMINAFFPVLHCSKHCEEKSQFLKDQTPLQLITLQRNKRRPARKAFISRSGDLTTFKSVFLPSCRKKLALFPTNQTTQRRLLLLYALATWLGLIFFPSLLYLTLGGGARLRRPSRERTLLKCKLR
jgi:hypothetical protein